MFQTRDKRKLDDDVLAPPTPLEPVKENPDSLPSLPKADATPSAKKEEVKKLTTPDNKDLKPEQAGGTPEAERVKKQACVKVRYKFCLRAIDKRESKRRK